MKTSLLPHVLFLFIFALFSAVVHGQVSVTAIDTAVTQDFNSLASSGTNLTFTDNTTLPGWYANWGIYTAGFGSSSGGTLYSFGQSSNSERALGSIASGGNKIYGLRLKNNTGTTITSLEVSYTGEQWQKSGATSVQTLTVDYRQAPNVTDLVTGTYTAVAGLNFSSPVFTSGFLALNGNLAANRTAIAATITVNIPAGEELMIRWSDVNDADLDHALAIDDLSITPRATSSTRTVTKIDDTNDGTCDSDCSLREAITAASSGDTIVFSSLFNTLQTITLGSEIAISKNLTVTGPGANLLTIDGGAGTNRIFYTQNSTVMLSGITLTGGNGTGSFSNEYGGAILIDGGTVTLDGLHVTGNSATTFGGGLYVEGGTNHVIRNSTFSANNSGLDAGALRTSFSVVSTTITNSTFSGNTAARLAAIVNGGGELIFQNSTMTGNSAPEIGGIYNEGTFRIRSSIIAGNSGLTPEFVAMGVVSEGFNLIGDSLGDSANTQLPMTYLPTDILDTDPNLAPLDNYAGPVPVHGLGAFPLSPAFDKGFSFGQTTDQRGFARTYDIPSITNAAGGDGTDIGAYERLAPTAAEVTVSGRVTRWAGTGINRAAVIVQGGDLSAPKRVLTSPFGYYTISGLTAGQTYIITVSAKRYRFPAPSRTVNLGDSLANLNFTASLK